MTKLIIVSIFLLITFSLSAQTKPSEITGISAKLFYNENSEMKEKNVAGTFSDNIIDNSSFALWNVIIGAGSADGYTNQMIVIVTVHSVDMPSAEQTLKLTVESNEKTLSTVSKKFYCVQSKTDYKILFLLDDTGCDELKLTADLIVKGKKVSKMERDIEFHCGE